MEYTNIFYVLASVLFILGIKKLSHPKTARHGNFLAFIGMLIAIAVTLLSYGELDFKIIQDVFTRFFTIKFEPFEINASLFSSMGTHILNFFKYC